MTASVTDALQVLRVIPDPELGVSIVDLGLVYDVTISDGRVHVTYTLTTLGCGIGPILASQIQEVLYTLPGVGLVTTELVFEPPWTRERMSAEARAAVGDRQFRPIRPGEGSALDRFLLEGPD